MGIAAGYLRGKTDYVLTVFFNIFLSIPNLILSLVLIAVLATSSDPTQTVADGRRIVVIIISLTIVIVVEGALSLLGIGVGQGISWGAMLARSQGDLEYAPTSLFVPLTFLAFTVIACNQVGDSLRQRLDSRE